MSGLIRITKTLMTKRPLFTNCIIYGSLYVAAEFSQQIITNKVLRDEPKDIDKPTLGRYFVMGTFIYSPILYNWYKWLDKKLPGTAKKVIVRKLLLDQFLLTPNLLVLFFTGMALMERAVDPFAELKEKFLPTFARSCLFWIPAQTLNFLVIPPKYRVIYVGTSSFIWVNILCWVKRQNLQSSQQIEEDAIVEEIDEEVEAVADDQVVIKK